MYLESHGLDAIWESYIDSGFKCGLALFVSVARMRPREWGNSQAQHVIGREFMARRTAQRAAIRQVFEETGRPLSPAEILQASQLFVPRLGLTTVYRTVNSLVEEGWLVPVELPGEADRYELAGKAHHHHFRCRCCSAVYTVPGCVEGLSGLLPKGFEMEGHALVLYGACAECCREPSSAPPEESATQHA